MSRSMLRLSNIKLEDSGNYVIRVSNADHEKSETFTLLVTEKPEIELNILEQTDTGLYQAGDHLTLRCVATGYPAPKLSWTFKSCDSYDDCSGETDHLRATKDIVG